MSLLLLACLGGLSLASCATAPAHRVPVEQRELARGADISWLGQLESRGVVWEDARGIETDAVELMADLGVNAVRLRSFVDPGRYGYEFTSPRGDTSLLGFCDEEGLVALAKRCRDAGMRIMINFHFGDSWTSNGRQALPLAWEGLDAAGVADAAAGYVTSVLTALRREGITPEWVELGNEISGGVLFPYGETARGWSGLVDILGRCYDAVKAVDPSILVVLQLDDGSNNRKYRRWFDNYRANGGRWDVIGMSFYPYWQPAGTVEGLLANMNDMVARYGTPVLVSEIGGIWDDPESTRTLIEDVTDAVAAVDRGYGMGFFYWEVESTPAVLPDAYPLGAAYEAAPNRLRFSPAMEAYSREPVSGSATGSGMAEGAGAPTGTTGSVGDAGMAAAAADTGAPADASADEPVRLDLLIRVPDSVPAGTVVYFSLTEPDHGPGGIVIAWTSAVCSGARTVISASMDGVRPGEYGLWAFVDIDGNAERTGYQPLSGDWAYGGSGAVGLGSVIEVAAADWRRFE